ncbi:MAG: ATP-binding protein [Spirochaetaceae bacterium]
MDDLLFQYNPWWDNADFLSGIRPRDRYVDWILSRLSDRQVLLLSGLRRIGKSTIMRLAIDQLIKKGHSPSSILYVSLDDYMLRQDSILDVVNGFRQIHKHSVDTPVIVMLDEITAKEGFQQQLKNLVDRERVNIVAASSSSSLLQDHKALLTGRSQTLEIQPLTLDEYLDFKDVSLARRDAQLLDRYFRDYVREGGLPEQVLHPSRDYLMNLVDDIIQKDITALHGLKDHQVVRDYFTLLMERSGRQVSINKLANILNLSPDTSRRYLGYFENAYLIYPVSRWGKTNERILSPKKIYACDLGIKHLFIGDRDWGSYFENYIYLRLRQHQRVHYVRHGEQELDFLTEDNTLIEAKYNSELAGAQLKAFEEFPATRKQVIGSVRDTQSINELWET